MRASVLLGARLALLALTPALPGGAAAFDLRVETEALRGPGWELTGLELIVERADDSSKHLMVRANALSLPALATSLSTLTMRCPAFVLSAVHIRCDDGRFSVGSSSQLITGEGSASFAYRRDDGRLDFMLQNFALAEGRATVHGALNEGTWRLQLGASGVEAASLFAWLRQALPGHTGGQRVVGRLDVSATLSGRGAQLRRGRLELSARRLDLVDPAGRASVRRLDADLIAQWQSLGGDRRDLTVELKGSRGVVETGLVALAVQPRESIGLRVRGSLDADRRFDITSLDLLHAGVLRAKGDLALNLSGKGDLLERADLAVAKTSLAAVYSAYVQPGAVSSGAQALRTRGRIGGRLRYARGVVQALELDLETVSVEHPEDRFGVNDLNGRLSWDLESSQPRRSELRWRRGHVYRLPVGEARLALESRGSVFRLLGEANMPVLDGAMVIERLQGRGLGSEALEWRLDGLLTPISLPSLCRALDWVPLSGKLSGVIPGVRYADGRLDVGGALLVKVFDGDITVTNLGLKEPLGLKPRLSADLDLRDLDLLTLTRAFDFGKIEGKLDGRVRGLRVEDWRPVRFDAALYSPGETRGRRRISQQAVENLSALSGGGVTEVLSRGVLGMFETFRYKRLGIRCRLVNGICEMDGVAPARNGYYLVEGGGVPRIDVIGYNRRVDWNELVGRLRAAASGEAPVVR